MKKEYYRCPNCDKLILFKDEIERHKYECQSDTKNCTCYADRKPDGSIERNTYCPVHAPIRSDSIAGDKECLCHCHFGGDIEACNKAKGHPIRECKHCSKDPVSGTEEVEHNPRSYGKSSLVTNAFLAEAKAKNSVVFEHPDYICFSKKALESERAKAKVETLQSLKIGDLRMWLNEDRITDKKMVTDDEIKIMLGLKDTSL